MTPEAACNLIREKARSAVARASAIKPYRVAEPVDLDIRFKSYRPAEVLAYLPIVTRTDAHSVRFHAKDMLEASRIMEFVTNFEPGLAP